MAICATIPAEESCKHLCLGHFNITIAERQLLMEKQFIKQLSPFILLAYDLS